MVVFGLCGAPKRVFAVADPIEKGLFETPARVLPLLPPMSLAPLGALVVLSVSFGITSVEERTVATVDCTPLPTDAVVAGAMAVELATFATPTDVDVVVATGAVSI